MKKIKYDLVVKEFYLYEKWDDYIPSFIPYNESNYYYLLSCQSRASPRL